MIYTNLTPEQYEEYLAQKAKARAVLAKIKKDSKWLLSLPVKRLYDLEEVVPGTVFPDRDMLWEKRVSKDYWQEED